MSGLLERHMEIFLARPGMPSPARLALHLAVPVVAFVLSGCAVGPDYARPVIAMPASFSENIHWRDAASGTATPGPATLAAATPAAVPSNQAAHAGAQACTGWWCPFGDPMLDRLEQQALQSNQLISAAVDDYRRSLALAEQARSSLYPQVDALAGVSRNREASADERENTFNHFQITAVHAVAQARWEPDLWGQVRRTLESASASSDAAAAASAGVRLSLAAALASTYFDLRALDQDLQDLEQERQLEMQLETMTRAAADQGMADADAIARARNAIDLLDAQAGRERTARALDEHAVAAIIAQAPEHLSIAPIHDYRLPTPDVQAGLPSALLERRPDVVQAEREAAAANARIGVAQAAFFPDLAIGASIGGESSALAGLLSAPARIWSLGPSVAASLFDAGSHTAQLQQARAAYDATAARYRATVIAAFRDVEDSLAAQHDADQAQAGLRQVLDRSEQIFQRQQVQEQLGLASRMTLAQARIACLDARRQWQASVAAATQDRVALVKAIGGGWRPCNRVRNVSARSGRLPPG